MSGDTEQGTHFYLIAVQTRPAGGGLVITQSQGHWTAARKQTRLDVFNEIRKLLAEAYPVTTDGAVIAFDLQPNKL